MNKPNQMQRTTPEWTLDLPNNAQTQHPPTQTVSDWPYRDLKREYVKVTTQRDELLAACKQLLTAAEIVDGCETHDDSDTEHLLESFDNARSAIQKAEAAQ